MAAKSKVEHGFLAVTVGQFDSESTQTKASFLATLANTYPESEGWKVWNVTSAPNPIQIGGSLVYLPYVTYFVKRGEEQVNG